ncbi:MAG: hypothetical protein H0W25_04310 [Acidimicrobiia bacterium]|nr:hypothetical protein [Acidimicrobiia bacterium]
MGDARRRLGALIATVLVSGIGAAGASPAGGDRHEPRAAVPATAVRATAEVADDGIAVTVDAPVVGSVTAGVALDPTRPDRPADVHVTGTCDDLDPAHCLLPFPNDLFTVPDRGTDTGRRVDLDLLAMPRNVAGLPIRPDEWNRNDGFSPGTPILARVPGLDLHATWSSPLDHVQDLSWYLRPDAPIVLLDADTGRRHPFWSELDTNAGTTDDERLLVLRPAVNLAEGHRYIVALRRLRDAGGAVIAAGPAFAAHRDGTADPTDPRTADIQEILGTLAAAGVQSDDLHLAWDFTVASERNLSERALSIRNDAFAALGDADLADRIVSGRPPDFTIDLVEDRADGPTMRHIEGTVTVPNYLTVQAEAGISPPLDGPVLDLLDALPPEVEDAADGLGLPIGVRDLIGPTFALPGSRFNTLGSDDGLPVVYPVQPTVTVPFTCNVARGSDLDPSDPLLYGHGLLGSRDEVNGSSTRELQERGFSPCSVDWWGMSTSDLPNVAAILLDASAFPSLADRAQQGFLNFLFLGRALAHPGGFAADPAFQSPAGSPLIDPATLGYDGNSQGAIMGGALTALAPDLTRAVLGVPGMNYSTLLNRSVDWEGAYGAVFYAAYPGAIDQQLTFALLQMLWDRAEANGYAHHMSDDPLAGTPPHEVFLQAAFADHQVANVAAEVEARTIGARLVAPATPPGLHWSVDPGFGLDPIEGDAPAAGSVLVYWYTTDRGLGTPPNGNVPMTAGSDPHGDPRKLDAATDQVAHWLRTGDPVDVCGAAACTMTRQ